MSHLDFTKNEIDLILELRKIIPKNINLKVKLHGSNPDFILKKLSQFNLVDKSLFSFDKPNFTYNDFEKQNLFISKYDICIGLSTTFFLKAFISGIKHHFFISDKKFFPYTGCYGREHHIILFEYIKAIEVKNIYDFPKLINNLNVY